MEISVEEGFTELWEVLLELVSCEVWVESIELVDKLEELTWEVEVTMDEDVEGLDEEEVEEGFGEGEGTGGLVGVGGVGEGGDGLGDGDGLGEGDGLGVGDGLGGVCDVGGARGVHGPHPEVEVSVAGGPVGGNSLLRP